MDDYGLHNNFGGDSSYIDFIKEKFDYLICGHSHLKRNFEIGERKLKVRNSGSNYEQPRIESINIKCE